MVANEVPSAWAASAPGGGRVRVSSLAGVTLAAIVAALAGGLAFWILHWALAGIGGSGRILFALAAAVAMFTVAPALAGALAGYVLGKGCVLADCVSRRATALAGAVAGLGTAAVFSGLRVLQLHESAFDSGLDVAKLVVLAIVGTAVCGAVAQDQVDGVPACASCKRFLRKRASRFDAGRLDALLADLRGKSWESLAAWLHPSEGVAGERWAELELSSCPSCHRVGLVEVFDAYVRTAGREDQKTSETVKKRVFSAVLAAPELERLGTALAARR